MQNSKIVSNVTDKSAWVTARGREKTGGSAASKTRKIAIVTVTHRQNPNTSQSKYDARAEDRATTQTSASNSDTGIGVFFQDFLLSAKSCWTLLHLPYAYVCEVANFGDSSLNGFCHAHSAAALRVQEGRG